MLIRRHQRMRADVPAAMPAVAYDDHVAELAAKDARIADLEAQLASKVSDEEGKPDDHVAELAAKDAAPAAADPEDDKGGKPGKKASK